MVALISNFCLADDFPSLRALLKVVPQSKDDFYRNLDIFISFVKNVWDEKYFHVILMHLWIEKVFRYPSVITFPFLDIIRHGSGSSDRPSVHPVRQDSQRKTDPFSE